MFFFNAGLGAKKKRGARRGLSMASTAMWLGAFLLLHVVAYGILSHTGVAAQHVPHAVVMGLTGIYAVAVSMMLSQGLKSSVEVLFERGDLDLLLSSPLASRGIFAVRLAGIVVGVASFYLFMLAPVAHVGLALGQYRWLGIYPVVIGTAAIAASLAMLFTLGLVRVLGIRRTRVVAQVIGALSGAMAFLLSQLYAHSLDGPRQRFSDWVGPLLAPGAAFGPDSSLWLPGRAILGAPLPLLALSIVALIVFVLTIGFTHRFFVHGVQQAVSLVRVARAPSGGQGYRFGRSLTRVVIAKEWRLIARDPQLISQVLLQLLYMLPLCLLLLTKGGGAGLAGVGASLTFLCGSLTGSLAWVIIAAEDAPDLLRAAPSSMATIRRAKLAAVALPAPALMALPLLWVLLRDPLSALLMAATVGAAVTSSAMIAMWCGRPAARADFKARGKANFLSNALEMLNGFAWAGLAYLLLMMSTAHAMSHTMLIGAVGLMVIAIGIGLLGWLFRQREH